MLGAGWASAQPTEPRASAPPRVRALARGRVLDAAGAPVRGATVSVEGEAREVTTAADGSFSLEAPAGATLIVLRDGYGAGLATVGDELTVVLVAETTETIEVRGETPVAAPGAAKLDRATVQRIPGTGNDLVRSLSAMPGVASYPLPLGQAGVVIRGASPQDSKVLVDGFEVPSIYHDLGFRSIIPAEAIDSLEYIPGGFDVAFGRAASGIVSLTTRAGAERTAQQAELSAGDGSVLAQGPLGGGRGRYLIAFRRSTIDFLLPALLPDDLDLSLTTVPRFYDEQLRVDYRLSSKWDLRVSSVGSDDALELYASRDRNADKRFANRTRFVRVTAAARYHDGPWSGTLALSGIAQQFTFERGLYQRMEATAPALTARAELARTAPRLDGLTDVEWRLGGEVVTTRTRLDLALPQDTLEGEPMQPDDPMDTTLRYQGTIPTQNAATWTSLAANLDERVRLTAGVRVDAYTRSRELAVQPRGELAVKLPRRVVVRLSAGAYSRPAEHQSELLQEGLRGERSTQLIAGVAYEPADGARLQASAYYIDRHSLVTRGEAGMLTNAGRGTSAGGELLGTVQRGPWFGWLAYSYSRSTRVDAPGGERRLFDYDQPHSLNVAASYKIGRWQLGARFRLHSGLPQTPVAAALFDSDANVYYPAYGVVNSERAAMHHQLDLRFDKSFRWGPVKMTKFLDIQNVYLNDSVVGYFYGFDYSQRGAFRSLPILPTAGLRGEF